MRTAMITIAVVGALVSVGSWVACGSGSAADAQTLWYPSGQIQAKATLEDGVREGPATEWYQNGNLRCSGDYRGGLREGAWTFYTENGDVDPNASGTYEAGERIGP